MSTPSDAVEIYCLKCRAKTPSRDVERVTMKNGRPALRAVCADCGTGKYRIGASDWRRGLAFGVSSSLGQFGVVPSLTCLRLAPDTVISSHSEFAARWRLPMSGGARVFAMSMGATTTNQGSSQFPCSGVTDSWTV